MTSPPLLAVASPLPGNDSKNGATGAGGSVVEDGRFVLSEGRHNLDPEDHSNAAPSQRDLERAERSIHGSVGILQQLKIGR